MTKRSKMKNTQTSNLNETDIVSFITQKYLIQVKQREAGPSLMGSCPSAVLVSRGNLN